MGKNAQKILQENPGLPGKMLQNLCNKNPRHISAEGPGQKLKKAVAVSEAKIQQRSRRQGQFSSSHFPCRNVPNPWQG